MIGTADVISSVGRRALTTYHQTTYRAGNVVVAAAGNLKHDELVSRLEKAQRKQAKTPTRGPRLRAPLVRPPRPSMRFERKKTEQYHVCVGAPGIARSDRRRFAASFSTRYLAARPRRASSRRSERSGMAYSVYTFASQYTDTGLIGFYVGTRAENLADCLEIANEQIAEVADGKLRKGELERAKENLKGRILLSMESTSNRMSRLGKSLITDTELLSIDRIAAEIDAVTPESVAELASVLLSPEKLSASGIGPSEERFRDACGGSSRSCPPALQREGRALRRGGKVGSVLGPALEAAGHVLVELGEAEAMVDFTSPEVVVENITRALDVGVPWSSERAAGRRTTSQRRRTRPAYLSSMPRTSRSARS